MHAGIIVTGVEEDGATRRPTLGVEDERARPGDKFRAWPPNAYAHPRLQGLQRAAADSPAARRSAVVEVPRAGSLIGDVEKEAWRYPSASPPTPSGWASPNSRPLREAVHSAAETQTRLQGLAENCAPLRKNLTRVGRRDGCPVGPAPLDDAPTINPSAADPVLSQILLELPPAERVCP